MRLQRLLLVFILTLVPAAALGQGIDAVFQNPNANSEWSTCFGSIFKSAKSIALIVAISDYTGEEREGYKALPTARNDAEKMRNFLINNEGYDTVYLLTEEKVTKQRLEELMVDVFPTIVGPADRFLFYWSGHGDQWTNKVSKITFGYLPLRNSKKNNFSTMVSMEDIARWDRFLSARHALFIVDACLSGLAGVQAKADMRSLTLDQLSGSAHFLITAGTGTENVISAERWQGSLFTDALIIGAKGAAASSTFGDWVVSLSDLMSYVRRRVASERELANWRGTLTPQMRQLQTSDGEYFFLPSEPSIVKSGDLEKSRSPIVPESKSQQLTPDQPMTHADTEIAFAGQWKVVTMDRNCRKRGRAFPVRINRGVLTSNVARELNGKVDAEGRLNFTYAVRNETGTSWKNHLRGSIAGNNGSGETRSLGIGTDCQGTFTISRCEVWPTCK